MKQHAMVGLLMNYIGLIFVMLMASGAGIWLSLMVFILVMIGVLIELWRGIIKIIIEEDVMHAKSFLSQKTIKIYDIRSIKPVSWHKAAFSIYPGCLAIEHTKGTIFVGYLDNLQDFLETIKLKNPYVHIDKWEEFENILGI